MKQGIPPETLSGSRLEAFLDDTDEAVDQQFEADVADDIVQAGLAATLARQSCHADSMAALYKLHRLWLRALKPDQALRVLDEQGPGVALALPPAEKPSAELAIAFWRIAAQSQAKTMGLGAEGLLACLQGAEALLARQPQPEQSDDDWNRLARWAHDAGDFDLQRRCFAAIHAEQKAHPQRAAYRAWDEAVQSLRCGDSFALQGDAGQARACALAAIETLVKATPDQDLDHHDWLRLSDGLLALAPESLQVIAKNIRDRLPRDASLPVRRGVEVRVARLEAKAAAAQGRLDEALAKGQQGRYSLTDDADDGFTSLVMDWLIQTGHDEAAGKLAFESMYNERPGSAEHAGRLAQAELAKGAPAHPYWALTLACATEDDDMKWLWEGEEAPAFAARHIALAEQAAPAHPATAAVRAFQILGAGGSEPEALALLETAVRHADLASSKNIDQLWLSRMRLHGAAKALAMPVVPAAAGGWCYNIGVALDHRLEDQLPKGTQFNGDAVAALAANYYEMGLYRFESFFASGQGHYKDGDVHAYSMLCNNLAIYYRYNSKTPQNALALHRKGIQASPFAEHYHGLMQTHQKLGQQAEYVQAADQLWHFAQENGYSRHDPSDYASWVCGALIALDRRAEVPIWLQRLDEWWAQQGDDDKDEKTLISYLGTLTSILAKMSATQPEDALARLEPALPQVLSVNDPCCRRLAGLTLENAGQLDRALQLFQQASQLGTQEEGDRQQRQYAQGDIQRCKEAMGQGKRPWWKVW